MKKTLDIAVIEKLAKDWNELVCWACSLEREFSREARKNLKTVEALSAVLVVDEENRIIGTNIAGGKGGVNEVLKKEYEKFVEDCKKHLEKFADLPYSTISLTNDLANLWPDILKGIRTWSLHGSVLVKVHLENEITDCGEVWSFFSNGKETVLYDSRKVDLAYSYNQVFMSAMGVELL